MTGAIALLFARGHQLDAACTRPVSRQRCSSRSRAHASRRTLICSAFVVAFATALGGGVIRDLLLGDTPLAVNRVAIARGACVVALIYELGSRIAGSAADHEYRAPLPERARARRVQSGTRWPWRRWVQTQLQTRRAETRRNRRDVQGRVNNGCQVKPGLLRGVARGGRPSPRRGVSFGAPSAGIFTGGSNGTRKGRRPSESFIPIAITKKVGDARQRCLRVPVLSQRFDRTRHDLRAPRVLDELTARPGFSTVRWEIRPSGLPMN